MAKETKTAQLIRRKEFEYVCSNCGQRHIEQPIRCSNRKECGRMFSGKVIGAQVPKNQAPSLQE